MQISHWRGGAEDDWAAAEDLIRLGRVRHGLFFAHLALEKAIKAHKGTYLSDDWRLAAACSPTPSAR